MTADLTKSLHQEIPISKHMGLKIVEASAERVILKAPLDLNSNHKGTAFGGSIYSITVLACWTNINEVLRKHQVGNDYIVIQDSQMEYLLPVTTEFTGETRWSKGDRDKFIKSLERKGLGRAKIEAQVVCKGKVCARFTGRFVARLDL